MTKLISYLPKFIRYDLRIKWKIHTLETYVSKETENIQIDINKKTQCGMFAVVLVIFSRTYFIWVAEISAACGWHLSLSLYLSSGMKNEK